MVMCEHQRLPHVTHFQHFWVNPWTNEEVPRGSSYNDVAYRIVMWRDDVVD
jgi:hypothetical protein